SDGGEWSSWMAFFPPEKGLPGDPLTDSNPFTVGSYLLRWLNLLIWWLDAAMPNPSASPPRSQSGDSMACAFSDETAGGVRAKVSRLATLGLVATVGGLVEALNVLQMALATAWGRSDPNVVRVLERVAGAARVQLEAMLANDDNARRLWEVADLVL